MAIGGLITPFVWGEGGAKLTPEEIARQRKVLDALAGKTDTSPVGHWSQGLARITDAIGDVVKDRRLDSAEKTNAAANSDIITRLLSGGASAPNADIASSAATSGVAEELAASSPAPASSASVPVTGETFTPFIDTVRAGGLTNPFGLAAVAATGKAESGWSAQNASRTWSDPSESGKPGTAGGIMSWRGPRYQALAATGDLSPEGQARFFLQEDPNLIASLNNAKSVEEAQGLINKAWAFAGYDRPGGETARRLSLAQGYLPQFQGGAQVASLDPSAGMTTPAGAIDAIAPPSGAVAPEQPVFDAGRFSDPIKLSEMPAGVGDLGARLGAQASSFAPPLPPPTTVAPAPAVSSPEITAATPPSVAEALVSPTQVAQAQPSQSSPTINPAIIEALSSPYADEATKRIAGLLLQQNLDRQQKANDPMTALDQQYKQVQIDKMRSDIAAGPKGGETFFGNPIAVQNADGSVAYGQIGNKGSFRPIQLGQGQTFAPPTRTVDTGTETILMDQAGNVVSRTPKQNREAAAQTAQGSSEGKSTAETQSEYNSITSKMPGLYSVIDRLSTLADKATYTMAGRTRDFAMTQLGMDASEGAKARAEYTAVIDNQILPLLKDTFGAQFTDAEGLRLAKTLGDADSTPAEKQALLRAFIQQKERDIQALQNKMGRNDSPASPKAGARLRFNPQTGNLE